MREYKSDAISIIASVGSVALVGLHFIWDIVTAQWTHLFYYAMAFIACCIVCFRFVGASGDDNDNGNTPESSSTSM